MKILHAADLHLGAPMRAHLCASERRMRQSELLSAFLRLLDFAKAEDCAAVLLAGDLFDSEAAAAALSASVFSEMEKMPKTDFYYAPGNHEGEAAFCGRLPKNLHIFGNSFSYFKKDGVTFFGKKTPTGFDFANITLQKEDFNILVLHGAWSDGENERAEIPLHLLAGRHIDYCALGHYHTYAAKRIDERTTAVYSGCLEGRGFDETGPKGAVLAEIKNGRFTHRFVPLAKRTLHSITADISEADGSLQIFTACERALTDVRADDLVRLILTGERKNAAPVDTRAVEHHFSDRFYYFEAEDRSSLRPDTKALREEDSVLGEYIRLIEADASLGEDERARILSLGLSALGISGGGLWN